MSTFNSSQTERRYPVTCVIVTVAAGKACDGWVTAATEPVTCRRHARHAPRHVISGLVADWVVA